MPKTPATPLLPQHKALLAVDVVGSGGNDGRHLRAIPGIVAELVDTALASRDVTHTSKVDDQHTGDGFLRLYPAEHLPALLDALRALDDEVTEHNTWRKPEVALRAALHLGSVPEERGFHRPNIDLTRLLGAPEFKRVVRKCQDTGDKFTTALILSAEAHSAAFHGDLTRLVDPDEFAAISVQNNEYSARAWIRAAGFAPHQLSEFAAHEQEPAQAGAFAAGATPQQPAESAASSQGTITSHGPVQGSQNTGDHAHVGDTNHVNVRTHTQRNNGVQAGQVHGDVNQGCHRR